MKKHTDSDRRRVSEFVLAEQDEEIVVIREPVEPSVETCEPDCRRA